MTFKGPGGFGRIVNGVMNIIMCAILSFYVLWTVQNLPGNEALPILTPLGFFVSWIESFCVGMFIGDFVPGLAWGQKLAAALKIKKRYCRALCERFRSRFCHDHVHQLYLHVAQQRPGWGHGGYHSGMDDGLSVPAGLRVHRPAHHPQADHEARDGYQRLRSRSGTCSREAKRSGVVIDASTP